MKKHIISLWVKNKHGVLSRVSGTFNRRAYNIDSFSSGKINDDDIYRMTIILTGEDVTIDMIMKQLSKLQDVVKVVELNTDISLIRELVLVKIKFDSVQKIEVNKIGESFGAKIIRAEESQATFELVSGPEAIDEFLHVLTPFEILSASRSGAVVVE